METLTLIFFGGEALPTTQAYVITGGTKEQAREAAYDHATDQYAAVLRGSCAEDEMTLALICQGDITGTIDQTWSPVDIHRLNAADPQPPRDTPRIHWYQQVLRRDASSYDDYIGREVYAPGDPWQSAADWAVDRLKDAHMVQYPTGTLEFIVSPHAPQTVSPTAGTPYMLRARLTGFTQADIDAISSRARELSDHASLLIDNAELAQEAHQLTMREEV